MIQSDSISIKDTYSRLHSSAQQPLLHRSGSSDINPGGVLIRSKSSVGKARRNIFSTRRAHKGRGGLTPQLTPGSIHTAHPLSLFYHHQDSAHGSLPQPNPPGPSSADSGGAPQNNTSNIINYLQRE